MSTPRKHSTHAAQGILRAFGACRSRPCFRRKGTAEGVFPGMLDVRTKCVDESREASDGRRVLVDRIRPPGIKRQDAAADEWLQDLAPSRELLEWFGDDRKRWPEFRSVRVGRAHG